MSLNVRICSTKKFFDRKTNTFKAVHPMIKLDTYVPVPDGTSVYTDYSFMNAAPVIHFSPELDGNVVYYLEQSDKAYFRNGEKTMGRLSCEPALPKLSEANQRTLNFKLDGCITNEMYLEIIADTGLPNNEATKKLITGVYEWTRVQLERFYQDIVMRGLEGQWDFLPWGYYFKDGVWLAEEGFSIHSMRILLEQHSDLFEFDFGPKLLRLRVK